MFKGIYLASGNANHPGFDILYQDIAIKRDLAGDMLTIDLSPYDFIIATPPCNFWSRANYRRNSSVYALSTRYLLPCILYKLILTNKPFIVENVRNDKLFSSYGLFDLNLFVYKIGRHTYWSNVYIPGLSDIIQLPLVDFKNGKKRYLSSQNLSRSMRQGGKEVHEVIDCFLKYLFSFILF